MDSSVTYADLPYFFASCFMYRVSTVCPGQAEEVFSYMSGDFMKPVVDIVDQLLTAGVNVTVYNGQLDLIVDTMGKLLNSIQASCVNMWVYVRKYFASCVLHPCDDKRKPSAGLKVLPYLQLRQQQQQQRLLKLSLIIQMILSSQVRSCGWSGWSGRGFLDLLSCVGPPWTTPPLQASPAHSTRLIRTLLSIGSWKPVTWWDDGGGHALCGTQKDNLWLFDWVTVELRDIK